jgi:hypothetical protein
MSGSIGLDPDIFSAIWLDSGEIVIDESHVPEDVLRWTGVTVTRAIIF